MSIRRGGCGRKLCRTDWFDAIEDGVRGSGARELSRRCWRRNFPRRCRVHMVGASGEDEAKPSVVGVRHGHRERTLTGTFGRACGSPCRALRLTGEDGKTREWRSRFAARLPAPHPGRRRLDRRGLSRGDQHPPRATRDPDAVFAGPGRQGRGQRLWRKTKGDWDAWNARSLAEEPIDRLILDGTTARGRLDRGRPRSRCSWRLACAPTTKLLAIKSMGEAPGGLDGTLLDDLVRRGLRTPELVVIDGAPGLEEKAVAALWPDMAVQRCTVHKHRSNLLAHAPERLHEEISNDYDVICAARRAAGMEPARKAFIRKWRLKCPAPSPTAGGSRRQAVRPRGSRRANGNRSEPRTRSSDCTRSSSAGSRLQTRALRYKPPPCCSGRCSPQDRSPCARSTDGRPSPRNQTIRSLTSRHDRIASCRPKTRQSIPTQVATGPL